jgi:hypothetical protein
MFLTFCLTKITVYDKRFGGFLKKLLVTNILKHHNKIIFAGKYFLIKKHTGKAKTRNIGG